MPAGQGHLIELILAAYGFMLFVHYCSRLVTLVVLSVGGWRLWRVTFGTGPVIARRPGRPTTELRLFPLGIGYRLPQADGELLHPERHSPARGIPVPRRGALGRADRRRPRRGQ